MNILLVITKSDLGGAQVFVLNLAKSLKKRGVHVEIAAGDGDYLFNELQKEKINYYYLNSLKRDFNAINGIRFVFELNKLLKQKNFQIVHLNSSNTLIGVLSGWFIKERPKFVFTFHGLSFIDKNFISGIFLKTIANLYHKLLLKMVDKNVFECKLNSDEIVKRGIVNSGEIIYNGLNPSDLNYLSREKAREYFSAIWNMDLSNSFIIGTTGRLTYQKNYEFLINAFSLFIQKVKNVKLIIIGDGPYKNDHASHIRKLGLENDILLVGTLKNSFLYMKGFDVFTLTSRYEGISISLIEALYAEIPILVTDVGGNRDVVGNNEKELFPLDDVNNFISKLLGIYKNGKYYMEFNSTIQERFSLDNMTNNYLELYRSLIKY